MNRNLKSDAVKKFGGTRKLANAIGVSPQAVYAWPEVLTPLLQDRVEAAWQRKLSGQPDRSRPVRALDFGY